MNIVTFIQTHWQEIVGTLLGFLYLYYELKALKAMFPTGILMSLFYVVVFFDSKFYAFASINLYFIFAQAYAWWKWHKNTDSEQVQLIHTSKKTWLPILGAAIILFAALWWVLSQAPKESSVAWGDSLITTLSIIAIWMLAQHHVEQWLPLIVANAFSVYLFYVQGLYPTSLLYFVYLVASFAGYVNWSKMVKKIIENE